jgi:hypothetical protein
MCIAKLIFFSFYSALGTHDDDIDPERKKVTLLSRKPATDTPFKKPSPKTLDPVQLKRRIKNTLAEYYEMADTEVRNGKERECPSNNLWMLYIGTLHQHQGTGSTRHPGNLGRRTFSCD